MTEQSANAESPLAAIVRAVRPYLMRAMLFAVAVGAATVSLSFLVAKKFTADTRFTVVSDRANMSANRLAGFAAQFGIAAGVSSPETPDYFAAVASSREVLERVLTDSICSAPDRCQVVAQLLFDEPPATARENRDRQLAKLQQAIGVSVEPRTGIIRSSANGPSPAVAEGLLHAQLRAVQRALTERRESQARNERRFAESRLEQLEARRRAVVDSLTRFYEGNRQFEGAPSLRFRERALQDRLALWQELVQSVARQAETSRLEEVRDTPVLTILDRPYASPKKIAPKRSRWLLAGLTLGFLVGLRPDRLIESLRRRRAAPIVDVGLPRGAAGA